MSHQLDKSTQKIELIGLQENKIQFPTTSINILKRRFFKEIPTTTLIMQIKVMLQLR